MNKDELKIILNDHAKWLANKGGCCADLRGADLTGADLTDADLRGAYLTDADLTDADLRGAYLRGADLTGAYLRGAYLRGAYLRGANIYGIEAKRFACFTGLYKYIAMPIIAVDGSEHITLGCYTRTVSEWADNFWNNDSEFPNSGDIDSKLRWMAYQTCLAWLELNREVKNHDTQ